MDLLRRWRRWIRPACFTLYFICLIVALPLCIVELDSAGAPGYVEAWFIGGLFVMMAVPISFWGILQHLVYYTQPDLQRHIIRVLWMVPIYALNSWFALRFPSVAIYLDTLRECYEAYVIYNFMRYLLNFLYGEHPQLEAVLEQRPRVRHFVPFCFLPPWPRGGIFLNRCKHGVLQYTVVRPTMTVIALICELAGNYDEGNFNFHSGWSYIVIINNVSQIWAVYCLILFYKGTKEELAPINPVPKFLCVKAVVFLSFWQSMAIAALVKLDIIPSSGTWVFYSSVEEVATGLQDFLVCLEMFLAAVAHYFSFSYLPFAEGVTERGNCCTTCLSMWDVRDVRDDMVDHARYIGMCFGLSTSQMSIMSVCLSVCLPVCLSLCLHMFMHMRAGRGVQKQLGRSKPSGLDCTELTPLLTSSTTSVTSSQPSDTRSTLRKEILASPGQDNTVVDLDQSSEILASPGQDNTVVDLDQSSEILGGAPVTSTADSSVEVCADIDATPVQLTVAEAFGAQPRDADSAAGIFSSDGGKGIEVPDQSQNSAGTGNLSLKNV